MTENKEIRPKISYEECNRLVLAYRDDNDADAAEQLMNSFEGYLMKYYNVIRKGKVDMTQRYIREFVKLYMKNEYCRRHIHQFGRMPIVKKEIYSVTDSIKKLCEPYSDDELWNELYVALLTMAKRYQSPDGKPRFHHYILRAFHYQLRRQLQTLVSDPIVFKMASNVLYFDEDHEDDGYVTFDADSMEDQTPTFTIEEEMDGINDNWILGLTTEPEYSEFTIMERKIIKLYYVDELSDQAIADQLGVCRATINRRRNRVKDSLYDILKKSRRVSD
jgi:DNA-directed RNA polymerase specialized sigma24 family protein